jgi:hypothetical protein
LRNAPTDAFERLRKFQTLVIRLIAQKISAVENKGGSFWNFLFEVFHPNFPTAQPSLATSSYTGRFLRSFIHPTKIQWLPLESTYKIRRPRTVPTLKF